MSEPIMIPHLNPDAVVTIKVGAGLVQRFSMLLMNLIEGKTPEELKQIEEQDKENCPVL